MLQQSVGNIVAQGFLQLDVPCLDAGGDGAANQVVVHHFVEAVLRGGGVAQRHIHVHIDAHALRRLFFGFVHADVDVRFVIA